MVFLRQACTLGVALLVLLGPAVGASPADAHLEKSSAFIRDLADRATATLTAPDLNTQERRQKFRILFEEAFAVQGIARFVLGRYWSRATDEQKQEYLALFEREIVTTWADRFADYSGQKFEVGSAVPVASASKSENAAIVRSTFYTNPSSPVKVDWRVANRGDLFKITDVLVEGRSMANVHRDEYGAVISKNGGDVEALIAELRRRNGG